jgi:hypothetical protein
MNILSTKISPVFAALILSVFCLLPLKNGLAQNSDFQNKDVQAALQEFRAGLTATRAKYNAQKKLKDLNSITEIELMAAYADY